MGLSLSPHYCTLPDILLGVLLALLNLISSITVTLEGCVLSPSEAEEARGCQVPFSESHNRRARIVLDACLALKFSIISHYKCLLTICLGLGSGDIEMERHYPGDMLTNTPKICTVYELLQRREWPAQSGRWRKAH